MKQISALLACLCCSLFLTRTGFAQEVQSLESAVFESYPKQTTVPVVSFASPNTEDALKKIGAFFFGGPLTADMAQEDTGRYLYFTDDNSKLWYYPMSGAYDWVRTNPPVGVEFDTSDENIEGIKEIALSVLKDIRGQAGHPMESLNFVKISKVRAYTGTFASEGKDAEFFVRRVDVKFRQLIAGLPVYHGSWAVVSFCGDMEICRVRVLLRDVADVVESDVLPVETVASMMLSSASELDGPYYVNDVDQTREPIIVYSTRSESYRQTGAAPMLVIPVCKSVVTSKVADCEMRSSVAQPLVDGYEVIEGASRAKTRHKDSPEDLVAVQKPSNCEDSVEGPECAP